MTCDETAEFVSALFDGQQIPRNAAEHLGTCEACRARLQDYAVAAAELQRAASLNWATSLKPVEWNNEHRSRIGWWRKGAEVMKIPKFAFVLMLVLILGLSSSLVIVSARANMSGPVVLVTMKLPGGGEPLRCALFTNGNPRGAECASLNYVDGGFVETGIRFVKKDGGRIRLGIRTHFFRGLNVSASTEDLKTRPEREYELEPGEKLKIDIDGGGQGEMTGELLDHMPALASGQETLDPAEGELRVISPILLRGKEVVFDIEGGSATDRAKDATVTIYSPGIGRFIFSLQPLEGGVRGEVKLNRIHFDANGQSYHLVAGVPITRAEEVWVQLERNYKSSITSGEDRGLIGAGRPADFLGKQ